MNVPFPEPSPDAGLSVNETGRHLRVLPSEDPEPRPDPLAVLGPALKDLAALTHELQATVARNLGRVEARLVHLGLSSEAVESQVTRLCEGAPEEGGLLRARAQALAHANALQDALLQEQAHARHLAALYQQALAQQQALRYRVVDRGVWIFKRIPFAVPCARWALRLLRRMRGRPV